MIRETKAPLALSLCMVSFMWGQAFGALVPEYATYFGGSGEDEIVATAITPTNDIVLVGSSKAQSLPGTERAFQPTRAEGFPNNTDVFVAKFDSSGRTLLWATFLGGDGEDIPVAVAVDASGAIYVTGSTSSIEFPVSPNAYMPKPTAGQVNSFIAKIGADGSSLLYSSYLQRILSRDLAVNELGEAFIVGRSFLPTEEYVTPGAVNHQSNPNSPFSAGPMGVCLLRMNSAGTALVYGAYLGGGGFNGSNPSAISLDSSGNVYVAGSTAQGNLAVTEDALQVTYSNVDLTNSIGPGALDNGFAMKVDPSGARVLYGTYFGPRFAGTAIATLGLGLDGSVLFTGSTNAENLAPTTGAYRDTPGAGFIAKLTPGRSTLDSLSYLPDAPVAHFDAESRRAYVAFGTLAPDSSTPRILALDLTSLGDLSQEAPFDYLVPAALAPAGSGSIWALGSCDSCLPESLIPSDAYQPKATDGKDVVLVRMIEISPTISFVGDAATLEQPVAAGQLVTLFGSQIGPEKGVGAQLDSQGNISASNSTTRVTFDGHAAPILFTRDDQINTSIPCLLAGHSSAQVVVEYRGVSSPPTTIELVPHAPGIFTLTGSGAGQGAVLNQDYTINGPENPAARGSAVMIYATGVGAMSPPCEDGKIYQRTLPLVDSSVIVGVSHVGAQVLYAGQAPGMVAGVAQINALIPQNAPTGSVPISLRVGGRYSPIGPTIAVK